MNDRETIQLLQAEAQRSQDLILGLKEAAEKMTSRITDADILAARYQGEREAGRLELSRFRLATKAALEATGRCCDECEAATYRTASLLGITTADGSLPLEGLASELANLAYPDPKDESACTGAESFWCPVHGACACERGTDGTISQTCRLHRDGSGHDKDAAWWLAKADRVLADLVQDDGELTPEQAKRFKRIHDAGMAKCEPCGGSGSMLISGGGLKLVHRLPQNCPICEGTGQVPAPDLVTCPACYGTGGPDGHTGEATCRTCQGKGEIQRPLRPEVTDALDPEIVRQVIEAVARHTVAEIDTDIVEAIAAEACGEATPEQLALVRFIFETETEGR